MKQPCGVEIESKIKLQKNCITFLSMFSNKNPNEITTF